MRLYATPSLRGHGRRLEEDGIFVDYFVFLHSSDHFTPKDAIGILRATDLAVMTVTINTEMRSRGFDSNIEVEVISISADVLGGGGDGLVRTGKGLPGRPEPQGVFEGLNHTNRSATVPLPIYGNEHLFDEDRGEGGLGGVENTTGYQADRLHNTSTPLDDDVNRLDAEDNQEVREQGLEDDTSEGDLGGDAGDRADGDHQNRERGRGGGDGNK
jgi:hypothetical protein